MRTLKPIIISLVLGYSAQACGPDTINNTSYYGTGKGNGGSYTCQDAFRNEVDCIIAIENGLYADKREAILAEGIQECLEQNLSPDCLECIATAPCDVEQQRSPLYVCSEEGYCSFK